MCLWFCSQGPSGRGSLSRGDSVRGVSVWRCLSRESLSGGLCLGGLCLGVLFLGVSVRETPRMVRRGRCASYWNILVRRIQQFYNLQKLVSLLRDWTRIACLAATPTSTLECFLCLCEAVIECYSCMGDSVSHSKHYTRMFSVLVWGCNWMLFIHRWFWQPL